MSVIYGIFFPLVLGVYDVLRLWEGALSGAGIGFILASTEISSFPSEMTFWSQLFLTHFHALLRSKRSIGPSA